MRPMDLATRICWCGPNVWLKTGTGRFALPNTAANLRDPHKEANFLIGLDNYQLLGEDWYKKFSIATYVPNRLTQRGQADRQFAAEECAYLPLRNMLPLPADGWCTYV